LTYTFHLRSDIPWVKHDPITETTAQVLDGSNQPRFVTAQDFVHTFRRMCHPLVGGYYSSVMAPYIEGCFDVLNYHDPNNIPPILIEAIGVSAPNASTLVITLESPIGYFPVLMAMFNVAVIPQWVIDVHGDNWTDIDNIVTSGRYVLHQWEPTTRIEVWRNLYIPLALYGSGNIDRVVHDILPDVTTGYNRWLNNQVDTSFIPAQELTNHLTNYPNETDQISDLADFYIGFRTTKAPFDNVHLRRAFSAAVDRQQFINDERQGQGYAMRHFTPPGIFGAPPIDQVGVGYDLAFAVNQLAAAGYPNCNGLPTVTLMGYTGQSTLDWINYVKNEWVTKLGCNPNSITLTQLPFAELLAATSPSTPDAQAPHMFTLGWGPDYPDASNYIEPVLWCQTYENRFRRSCTSVDSLIEQARVETDPATRTNFYQQIEEQFFGINGEHPMIPMFVRASYQARHSWLTFAPVLFGGQEWYNWHIDWDAKLAAQ
jgi:oligopeptide transport system substrate-binding protein